MLKTRYAAVFVLLFSGCPADDPGPLEDAVVDASFPDTMADHGVVPDSAAEVAETSSDVAADATPDVAADATPDVATSDVATSDVAADTTPDVAADATPDVAADATPDVALDVADATADVAADATSDSADTPDGTTNIPACTGATCPIVVDGFPYYHAGDTSVSALDSFNTYNCGDQDESGPETLYVFEIDEPGTVVAMVTDDAGVDIDLHLLTDVDAQSCLERNDKGLSWTLEPGVYYLSADSYVTAGGTELPGGYELYMQFIPLWSVCAMDNKPIPRIGSTELLPMPATGLVVKEAHLVTKEEADAAVFPSGWPTSFTDGIPNHYIISQQASGYNVVRSEPWAPCCEPDNEYGQGSSAKPPAIAEAWYLNMRWKVKPPQGQRYIVFNGITGGAVVTAAGYENGPGLLTRVGGVAEEVHIELGTGHLDTLTVGVALAGDALSYGPIDCSQAAD